jgi:hypothetical protein
LSNTTSHHTQYPEPRNKNIEHQQTMLGTKGVSSLPGGWGKDKNRESTADTLVVAHVWNGWLFSMVQDKTEETYTAVAHNSV